MPTGLIMLITTQKVLKTCSVKGMNNTIWVVITPPNRHIASPLAMKEEESKQKQDQLYMAPKKMFQKKNFFEGIMHNLQQESPKSCPIIILGRLCVMQNQISKEVQLLENQPDTFHKNLSV